MKNEAFARETEDIRLSGSDRRFVKTIAESIRHAEFSKKLEKAIEQSCAAEVQCDDFFYLDDVDYLILLHSAELGPRSR